MYIVVEHEISDPKTFWDTARAGMSNLPPNLKLHQVLPNKGGTKAVCVWEAANLVDVEEFIQNAVGKVSRNSYFIVEAGNSIGLPGAR